MMAAAAGDASTLALSEALRSAIEEEFGAAARPLDPILTELEACAGAVDSQEGEPFTPNALRIEPLLDQIEDLLDLLRVGG